MASGVKKSKLTGLGRIEKKKLRKDRSDNNCGRRSEETRFCEG